VVLAVAVAVLPGSAVAAPGTPTPQCNGGGCGGWFKSQVTVTWAYDRAGVTKVDGCGSSVVSDDTSGATFSCTVWYGSPYYGNSVTVQKDSSAPKVTVGASRGPDANGWYTGPVSFTFKGDDGASGVASCTSGTYSGPDGGDVTVSGSCTDNAGNTGSASLKIKYDATAPTVTGTPSRKPDANGWYNHPVDVAFTGTDAGSGVSECSPVVSYKGPDASPAKLVGQCRDAAGHLSAPTTVELRYDATPPARPNLRWVHRGDSISLSWTAGKDVVLAKVLRSPPPQAAKGTKGKKGKKGKKPAVVYRGKAHSFVDRKLSSGTRYWYQVTLVDQAGNESSKTIGLQPTKGIFVPAEGSVVAEPPVVQWVPVGKARFYNLQLWRGNLKLLTTWVKRPKLALPLHWRFQGARHSFVDGSYRLYVWPAFGTKREPRYGKLVGQVSFVVKRR